MRHWIWCDIDQRIPILTSASPRSILVLSGRYHIISNASLVNNCKIFLVYIIYLMTCCIFYFFNLWNLLSNNTLRWHYSSLCFTGCVFLCCYGYLNQSVLIEYAQKPLTNAHIDKQDVKLLSETSSTSILLICDSIKISAPAYILFSMYTVYACFIFSG